MTYEEISTFWIKAAQLFEQTCQSMDKVWQKRKRVIDTRLLIVFILKQLLNRNKQGYGSSLSALWEARQKMPEAIFKTLNNELIALWHAHREIPTWKGHRVFAIDGSKLNLPRGLLKCGYKTPRNTTRHYPCGMVSCLYNLQEQLAYDFKLVSHNDERRCVPDHLAKLEMGDLVIFDRGYFSYLMLHQVIASGQHALFRLQHGTTNSLITKFLASDQDDSIIEYLPSTTVKHDLKKRGYTQDFRPLAVRLVKCKIEKESYLYATTLMDQIDYPAECFSGLYHGRWGIEVNWLGFSEHHKAWFF